MILAINNSKNKSKCVCINNILIPFGIGFSTIFCYYGFNYLRKNKYFNFNFDLNYYKKYFRLRFN